MTTMDSDSESQDSDDGRRFRFETTRKDSGSSLNSRKRKLSPTRRDAGRRSRSRDRGNRDRREGDRSRNDHRKESRSSLERRSSKEREAKVSKNSHDNTKSNFRHSKNSFNHRETNLRSSPPKIVRRDSKNQERRPRDREDERISTEKYKSRNSSHEISSRKRHSREKSRERSSQGSRTRDVSKPEIPSTQKSRKIGEKIRTDEDKNAMKKIASKALEKNSNSTNSRRTSSLSPKQECKDLNLSDFDIVSDTEENTLENSSSRKTDNKKSIVEPSEYEGGLKKRVSKQHYERLLKRQELKNRRDSEELIKVKVAKSERLQASNNNRNSDFLLGNELSDLRLKTNFETARSENIDDNIVEMNSGDSHSSLTNETIDSTTKVCRKTETRRDVDDKIGDSISDDSESSFAYGPLLPPKVHASQAHKSQKSQKIDSSEDQRVRRDETSETLVSRAQGDATSQKADVTQSPQDQKNTRSIQGNKKTERFIGPSLPDNFRCAEDEENEKEEDTFGPALPPHLTRESNVDADSLNEVVGSILFDDDEGEIEQKMENVKSESDDDDFMGPLPVDHPAMKDDLVQQQLERRARRLKAELAACDDEDEKKREEWMLELPPAKSANLGLGPRKFRVRAAPDMSDRSSWTDTPADKARKRMEKLENKGVGEPTVSGERDIRCRESEKSRKREKSLMEIHQKKLHKKKKKEEKDAKKIGKKVERRPFDRDIDLQANRFDEARKKSMFLKARELDDRFSRGKI